MSVDDVPCSCRVFVPENPDSFTVREGQTEREREQIERESVTNF